MKKLIILGITGSIGRQVVDVVVENKGKFEIVGFSFYENIELGRKYIDILKPKYVAIKSKYAYLQEEYPDIKFLLDKKGLVDLVLKEEDSIIFNAIVGLGGLEATMKAIMCNKKILLANKESLVVGGDFVLQELAKSKSEIIPVDSEHSAIFQALQGENKSDIKRIVLTCSGGALRDTPIKDLKNAKKEDVLNHPNWNMGYKITVDCATMINKAFEVAEAHYLFGVGYDDIKVLIHKESIVHSLVEFKDSNMKAILSNPSMHMPIAYALNYPDGRLPYQDYLDLTKQRLSFSEVNETRYPCYQLALEALKKGNIFPCVLNAANEAAVHLFLTEKISFDMIYQIIKDELKEAQFISDIKLSDIYRIDAEIKKKIVERYGGEYIW